MNIVVILLAALIPTITGFIWYNPAVLGKAWMSAADMTEEKMKGANMAVIFGVSLALSFFLAVSINFMVIHQTSMMSLFNGQPGFGEPGNEFTIYYNDFLERYGSIHRSFGHGAAHGLLAGLMFVLPVLGTNALFERKGFKYIAINVGYWMVTLILMGGVICQFG